MKESIIRAGEALLNIRYYLAKFSVLILPAKAYPHPTTVFNWTIFRKSFRARHFFMATFSVLLAIVGIMLVEYLFPFTEYSLLSGLYALISGGLEKVTGKTLTGIPAVLTTLGIFFILLSNTKDISGMVKGNVIMSKGLPKWAMKEEIAFRAGAENWTTAQRIMASLSFGLLHIINIIYPIAAVFALSACGFFFTLVYISEYKKTGSVPMALRESAMVHTTHNIIALVILAVAVLFGVILLVFSVF